MERRDENGVAHLLEHMVFRGGARYPTPHAVSAAVARLGGYLNGYITHDLVAYHATVRCDDAPAALDLLTDIVGKPRLDPADVDVERRVAVDEIARRRERPEVVADELLDRAAFGDHPLGRAVVGREEVVRGLTAEDLRGFRGRAYAPHRGVAVLVGDLRVVPSEQLTTLLERIPQIGSDAEPQRAAPEAANGRLAEQRGDGRSRLRLAYRVPIDVGENRSRAAFKVLASILGGSVGSRLYDDLRVRRGLCYSVFAVARTAADAALLTLSAEVGSDHSRETLTLMREHVERLRSEPPSEREVEDACRYLAGRRLLALEQTRAVARYVARERILYGCRVDPEDAVRSIEGVTSDDVARVARTLPDDFAFACVGPHSIDALV